MEEFDKLIKIIKTLREPDGCAWDREQTIETLKPYVIEEAYEVIDAIQNKNDDELCEELGDLMTQIVFISRIAEEQNKFDIADVCNGISEKLIRRHPHVFGDIKTSDTKVILKNWEKIKSIEKGEKRKSVLDDIPKSLPSLVKAFKVQKRMSRVGFDWANYHDAFEKIYEELEELKDSAENKIHSDIEEEFGDLIFSLINVARFFNVDCESALQFTINKVEKRFRYVEEQVRKKGKQLEQMSLSEMDELWEKAKSLYKVDK